ncbi:hypothetical protein INT44_003410 [Umbelopsis vinacea]|uniref:DH domain-containing protein n=1 Tax=Umbelopsis vinacea TaxID=44442 RepID=A0A8H7PWD5_9FUNG|nr:hypothetical protein INT44_003410 [Umbelopsis vinacea]
MAALTPSNVHNSYSYADDLDIVDDLGYDDIDDGYMGKYAQYVEKTHQNREAHLRELFVSEQAYVGTLQVIQKHYLEPLRAEAKNQARKFLGMQKIVCTDQEVNALFTNLENVYEVHREMLSLLDERFSRLWGPTQITWDIFQKSLPKLTVYDQFLREYPSALNTYQRLIKIPAFRKFMESCQKDSPCRKVSFLYLMKEPLHRISAYASLIPLIMTDTPVMHPDHNGLRAATKCINSISLHLIERIESGDNLWQMAQLQSSVLNIPNIFSPTRKLLLSGSMYRVNTQTQSLNPNVAFVLEPRTFLLFSDMLLVCKAKGDSGQLHFKNTVELRGMDVRNKSYRESNPFNVLELSPINAAQDEWIASNALIPLNAYEIRCNNQEQHAEWYQMLRKVLSDVNQTATAVTTNGSERTNDFGRVSTRISLISTTSTSTRSTKSTEDGYSFPAVKTPTSPSGSFDLQSKPKRNKDIVVLPGALKQAPNLVGGIYGGGFGLGRY